MKTAEELLKEKGITHETAHHNYAYVYRVACDLIGEAQKEAMRWRDPKEEVPKIGESVIVKYRTAKNKEKHGIGKYLDLGIGNQWTIEGSTGRKVIGWRPIE